MSSQPAAAAGTRAAHPTAAAARSGQWRWLAAGLALGFAIPFLLTDLPRSTATSTTPSYVAAVFGFVGAWLRFGVAAPRDLLTHHWRSGIAVGLAFVAVMAWIVQREPATGHPHGLEFAAAIAWRGVVYGFADGVILSAFPILAVFSAFEGKQVLERRRGKLAVGALALAVSLLFTAVYHLGYSDFRGEKLRKPLAGDAIWSVPTLVTLSPLASPITHAGLHVNAVVHSYDTDTFLPPHRSSAGAARPELQAILDSLVVGRGRIAPGATAYVLDARGAWLGAAGVADVQSGEPMPVDARMRLESVSKIWTGVLIHQLAEEGKLRLSDSVERWLPGLLALRRSDHRRAAPDPHERADRQQRRREEPRCLHRSVTDPAVKEQLLRVKRRLDQTPIAEFSPLLWIKLASFQPLLAEPGTHVPLLEHRLRDPRPDRRSRRRRKHRVALSGADLRAAGAPQHRVRPPRPHHGRARPRLRRRPRRPACGHDRGARGHRRRRRRRLQRRGDRPLPRRAHAGQASRPASSWS